MSPDEPWDLPALKRRYINGQLLTWWEHANGTREGFKLSRDPMRGTEPIPDLEGERLLKSEERPDR